MLGGADHGLPGAGLGRPRHGRHSHERHLQSQPRHLHCADSQGEQAGQVSFSSLFYVIVPVLSCQVTFFPRAQPAHWPTSTNYWSYAEENNVILYVAL